MAARRKKIKANIRVLIGSLLVLIVVFLGFARYIKTPEGKAFLLDIGFSSRYSEVQETVSAEILKALHEFDAYSIEEEKKESPLRGKKVVVIEARVPAQTSLVQLNVAVTEGVRRVGCRVISASEYSRGKGIEMRLGTRRYQTHILKLKRGKRALAPVRERIKEPLVAIIVDDFGYFKNSLVKGFIELDAPFTITIIPGLDNSSRIARAAREKGREFLCHMPMEPEKGRYDKVPMIRVGMSSKEIKNFIEWALESVPGVVGINNHMGSKATADEKLMRTVLSAIKEKKLFFVDSMTSPNSVAWKVAQALGVPSLRNDMFLDNRNEDTKKAMKRLIRIAKRRGYAVGIMHVKKKSLDDLRWFKEEAEKEGVRMTEISRLIEIVNSDKED